MKVLHKTRCGILAALLLLVTLLSGCTPAELPDEATVHAAYQQVIAGAENPVSYVYWDLNDDGIDELALKTGTKENNYRFKFYAYQQGEAVLIGDEIGYCSYLAFDGIHMIIAGDADGEEWAYRVTFINTLYRCQLEYDQAVRDGKPVVWPTIIEMTSVQ